MTLAARTTVAAAIFAAALAGAAQAFVAARMGIAAAVALPVAAAVGVGVLQRPIRGAQMAMLAVPLDFFSIKVGAAGLSVTEMLLLLTAVCSLLNWATGRSRPPLHQAGLAFAALCLTVALSLLAATDQVAVLKVLLMWSALTIVALTVAGSTSAELWRLLTCLAIAGGIAGAVAVAGGTNQSLSAGGTLASGRAQAGFSQPNVLGFFLVMAIPAAIVVSGHSRPLVRAVMLALAGCALFGLLLTLSRTGIVGTALALAVLLAWPSFRRVAAFGLAVMLVFATLNLDAIERSRQVSVVSERIATLGESHAVGGDPRVRIWKTGIAIASDHPVLGVGADNFAIASRPYGLRDEVGGSFDHAHDVPLTVAAELGLPGLLALGWLAAAVAGLVARALRRRGDRDLDLLALGAAAAIVGISIPSLGDYPARVNSIGGTFAVLIGVLIAVDRLRGGTGVARSPR
jgi:O-antigen ligase